jgi:hypothetical protein
MSKCVQKEWCIGYQIANAAIKPNGSNAAPSTNTFPDLEDEFTRIDVTNDTDQDIEVQYTTEFGEVGSFIVPKSVKTKTRVLAKGNLVNSSLKVFSCHNATLATGTITFNLSN